MPLCLILTIAACAPFEGPLHRSASSSLGDGDTNPVDDNPVSGEGEDENEIPVVIEEPDDVFQKPDTVFAINSSLISLAHGKGQKWDGCNKLQFVEGGYLSNTKCSSGTFLPAFASHLNEDFYQCIMDAAEAAELPRPVKVFINHIGTYVNRPVAGSSSLSFHAYARAIDISEFNLIDKDGNRVNISTHITKFTGPTIPFYNEFRQCWKESLASKGCRPGNREYKGTIGHTKSAMGGNSAHADHIHMSFPFCAG